MIKENDENMYQELGIEPILEVSKNDENMYQNFTGEDLTRRDFSNQDLSYSNFANSTLRGCNFENATLHFCNFKNADITGADFTGAKVSYSAWLINIPEGYEEHAAVSHRDLRNGSSIKSFADEDFFDFDSVPDSQLEVINRSPEYN